MGTEQQHTGCYITHLKMFKCALIFLKYICGLNLKVQKFTYITRIHLHLQDADNHETLCTNEQVISAVKASLDDIAKRNKVYINLHLKHLQRFFKGPFYHVISLFFFLEHFINLFLFNVKKND